MAFVGIPLRQFLDVPAAQARLTAVGGLGRHGPPRAGLIERIWPQVADRPGRLSSRPRNGPSSKPTGVRILKRRRRPISDVASDPTNISKERLLAACIIAIAASRVSLSAGGASSTDDSQQRTGPCTRRSSSRRLVHRIAYEVARSITWDAGRTATGYARY
jgi:hypothetical protein